MVLIELLVLIAAIVGAFTFRADDFLLAILVGVATLALTDLLRRISVLERQFLWPTFLCATIYRRREIRVSIAYLFSIPVKDKYLLVRGSRITTQYQPVGGVFKTYLADSELLRRFGAQPDDRFTVDSTSRSDLRIRVPGKSLYKVIRWFRSREDRELFPMREFHEELVRSGLLTAANFAVFDCRFGGLKHLPLRFDTYSQRMQLIIAEVYELRPTADQNHELEALFISPPVGAEVYFASADEIRRGGTVTGTSTQFDIPPTAFWLLGA